ncbi:hypothetical protein RRG08_064790 [Elysia crispata]|uniref:Uncharacterized protein n=1 Tax=Elysia crispata TaxID=231223 RepID=A0AAE0YS68_9GAST|nr:hypothetical protein RRG08_064790 [Elysia crispata]
MDSVDWKARLDADKSLCVIIMALTLLVNCALFLMILHATGGLFALFKHPRAPRYLTIVGLMIGDISTTFYCMCVAAIEVELFKQSNSERFLNKNRPYTSCTHIFMAELLFMYLMPFVYGLAFMILAAEGIYRRLKIRAEVTLESPNVLVSLVIAALPYKIGMAVVVPLTMVNIDYKDCHALYSDHIQRLKAIHGICLIGSVVASLFAMFLNIYMYLTHTTQIRRSSLPPSDSNVFSSTREKMVAFVPNLAFIVCVLTYGIFGLSYISNKDAKPMEPLSTHIIVTGVIFWLFALRPVVVPLCWLITGSCKEPPTA